VIDVVRELQRAGMDVQLTDPLASSDEAEHEYGVRLTPVASLRPADAVVFAVAHKDYVAGGWPLMAKLLRNGEGVVLDIKARLDRQKKPKGIDLWRP
jgi:UDP-N-acetyl-D-galactosamine dehydrogenase